MRKIIYNLATSLEGFIEGPNGEFDWCFTDQDYGMTPFMERVDTILFGRKSYEVMLQFEADPYPGKQKYVFSRQLQTTAPHTEVVHGELAATVRNLKQRQGQDIWLFGGATLAGELMRERLLDELMLSVHPILLGKGKPLFEALTHPVPLELIGTQAYDSGLVQVRYRVAG